MQTFFGESKGVTLYDLVNYNHTLYYSVFIIFIVICPIVSFKETALTDSEFTICKTGNFNSIIREWPLDIYRGEVAEEKATKKFTSEIL